MSCERHRDALADAAAGGAPTPGLQVHLAGCAPCAARLERMARALAEVDDALGLLRQASPAAGFEERIRRAAAASVHEGVPRMRVWPRALAAAAALAAVALAALLLRPGPRPAPRAGAVLPRPPAETVPLAPRPAAPPPERQTADHRRAAAPHTRAAGPAPGEARTAFVRPGEVGTLRRYVAALRRRRLGPDTLLVAGPAAALPEPGPLEPVTLDTRVLDSAVTHWDVPSGS